MWLDDIWNYGKQLEEIRALVEGALSVYEEDSAPLKTLAMYHQEYKACAAYNTIGKSLYLLRKSIKDMQLANTKRYCQLSEAVEKERANWEQ